ncbi:hypothetical protein B0H14DRAFT_2630168 [Mycena olivaceomarginata]|nr:hypothetical protein B0H14DRAFT_2630168 [Mycena olivaceomarginata]
MGRTGKIHSAPLPCSIIDAAPSAFGKRGSFYFFTEHPSTTKKSQNMGARIVPRGGKRTVSEALIQAHFKRAGAWIRPVPCTYCGVKHCEKFDYRVCGGRREVFRMVKYYLGRLGWPVIRAIKQELYIDDDGRAVAPGSAAQGWQVGLSTAKDTRWCKTLEGDTGFLKLTHDVADFNFTDNATANAGGSGSLQYILVGQMFCFESLVELLLQHSGYPDLNSMPSTPTALAANQGRLTLEALPPAWPQIKGVSSGY